MNRNVVYRKPVISRPALASMAALLAGAMLLVGFSSAASAAPVGKNGTIHACYKVKGKPRGALRVVRSPKVRCKRGERKVAWILTGATGQPGAAGQVGSSGQPGASGQAGGSSGTSNADQAALEAKVASLSVKVETLEGVLQGITNGDLTGMLATLQGLTNEDLLGAVGALPVLTSACTTLVEQSNELGSGLDGLIDVLAGVPLIGAIFDNVGIPQALNPLVTCPEPEA